MKGNAFIMKGNAFIMKGNVFIMNKNVIIMKGRAGASPAPTHANNPSQFTKQIVTKMCRLFFYCNICIVS